MKVVSIITSVYEKGEYVRTPRGVGFIVKVEPNYDNEGYYYGQTLHVKHKFWIDSTLNRILKIEGQNVILITKDEYDYEAN